MPLSDIKVRNLKPDIKTRRYADGGNLYVEVKPTGSKLWKLAYRFHGKQKTLSFGAYPGTTLAMARQKRDDAKALLANGIDPMETARAARAQATSSCENTFLQIGSQLLDKLRREGKAETTLSKKQWLLDIANADLGSRPIAEITPREILDVLYKRQALEQHETARRLRSTIGQVFRFAISTARAENDPTQALKGALITPKVRHMAALTSRDEFARLVRAIWHYESSSLEIRAALKLMALLYPRPIELRLAEWTEFDLEGGVWTIPAKRMKMRREHHKPLSKLAISILTDLKENGARQRLAFASLYANQRPISENTLNVCLRRMGFTQDEATSHGFRSSASSLLNESGNWPADFIEAELAHQDRNSIRRIYNRTRYFEDRKRMAEWWSSEIQSFLSSE